MFQNDRSRRVQRTNQGGNANVIAMNYRMSPLGYERMGDEPKLTKGPDFRQSANHRHRVMVMMTSQCISDCRVIRAGSLWDGTLNDVNQTCCTSRRGWGREIVDGSLVDGFIKHRSGIDEFAILSGTVR